MRWDDFRRSSNVEDERGASGGVPGGAGGLGIGTVIIIGLISWYFGIDAERAAQWRANPHRRRLDDATERSGARCR